MDSDELLSKISRLEKEKLTDSGEIDYCKKGTIIAKKGSSCNSQIYIPIDTTLLQVSGKREREIYI